MRALICALLIAGCATASVPPQVAHERAPICVPPGFRPMLDWHLEDQRASLLLTTDESSVLGVYRDLTRALIGKDEAKVQGLWVGQLLGIIDPAPNDYGVPVWYDAGVMEPTKDMQNLAVKVDRERRCDWKKFMVPREPANQGMPPLTPGEERRI